MPLKFWNITPQEKIRELELLRDSQYKLLKQKSNINFEKPTAEKRLFHRLRDKTQQVFKTFSSKYYAWFAQIKKRPPYAKTSYRQMQVEHGMNREAYTPDTLKTVLIIQGCILVEGLLTASLMIADDRMDVVGGFVYGLSISGINIAIGVMAGFFVARYMNWKSNSDYQTPRDVTIRTSSRIAFAGLVAVMGILHFAAARIRMTGSHTDIFNFSEITLSATFTDHYAIAIVFAGALGSILAIYQGVQGLSDTIPGYSKAQKEAEEIGDNTSEALYQQALNQLGRLYAEAREVIEVKNNSSEDEFTKFQHANLALNEAINRHNHSIDNAIDQLSSYVESGCGTPSIYKT